MAISLGGVLLPKTVIWEDRQINTQILQKREFTLGSKQIITYATIQKGQPITLLGTTDTGWLQLSVFNSIKTLAESIGSVYVFDYNGLLTDVMFKHDDPPALVGDPLVYRNNQQLEDYYTYTIKLVTV